MPNYEKIPVLDHGYIQIIRSWGSEEEIIEAARMSTNKGFLGWGGDCVECGGHGSEFFSHDHGDIPCSKCKGTGKSSGDEKLLAYLWKHKHATPFEMAGLIVEVQAPIMVFREWHRHRTFSFNEMSGRYVELPDMVYMPSDERMMAGKQSSTNKQASAEGFTLKEAQEYNTDLMNAYAYSRRYYRELLEKGVSRELARLVLPVAQYSRMRASANLRNWLAFLTLRLAPAAQYEIREYAQVVASLVQEHFPRTYSLFQEGLEQG